MIKARKFTVTHGIYDERGLVFGSVFKCSQGYCWGRGEDPQVPDVESKLYRTPEALEYGLFADAGFCAKQNGHLIPRLRVHA